MALTLKVGDGRAKYSAVAAPMPPLAPVIKITRSSILQRGYTFAWPFVFCDEKFTCCSCDVGKVMCVISEIRPKATLYPAFFTRSLQH